ncbi:MAG: DUF4249 domain-containing protein [Bacteroidales bacterium]|nr:DUF4249 domain-containing protein [Bacteroidales bacterium]
MKKLLLIIILPIFIATSCTERIDIELEETFTRLVVFGTLTTDTTRHYIELSKTTSYYYNQAPPPVTNAVVEISDDLGNRVLLTEEKPGFYATPTSFFVIPGRIYTLQIELEEEINGHRYYEASSAVNAINPIDSIGLIYQPLWGESGFYEVTCYYQDPLTQDFYMFDIYKNGELLTDTITNRIVVSDDFFNGSYTNGIGVGYLDQSKERELLFPGDTITFRGSNVTEEYYTFIWTLQQETGFQTPLFSGPPANIKGNISNGAVGFFAAYSVAYASAVFLP